MNEQNQQYIEEPQAEHEEVSIDYMKMLHDILKNWKLYVIIVPLAWIVTYLIMAAQPNYYNCIVRLAPEPTNDMAGSGFSLGSLFGGAMGGNEAIYPTLYPDLMNSTDFKTKLFPIKVKRSTDGKEMTYFDYLAYEQKKPWWENLFGAEKTRPQSKDTVNLFKLTPMQAFVAWKIGEKVTCLIDNKTQMISISVEDQDPLIAATIADSVKNRLQRAITDYRTSKVKVDLEYSKKLFEETKKRYEKARQLYASFADSNQDLILESVRVKQTDLENDLQLQFNAYTTVATQLQAAEAKVQQETPAFTTIQSAMVPLGPAGPNRKLPVYAVIFLSILFVTVWVLYKEGDFKQMMAIFS